MKKFQLINLFIYLNGFLIFEFLTIHPNKIFAKDLRKSNLIEININTPQFESIGNLNDIEISTGSYLSKNEVIEDLKANGDALFNLLAFEQKDIEDDFFVEIDSDTQYRKNNEFIAEGNVTIFLSDATLKGDLVKYDLENKLLTVIGNVTFKNAIDIHECAKEVPQSRFLVETDSPFLSPVPHRGKRNEPSFVKHVVEKISEIRGESFSKIAEKTTQNARELFALP